MNFSPPLIRGTLVKRYKRFMADILLDSGDQITAHCPNTGAMTGLLVSGAEVWVRDSENPERKLRYTWELVKIGSTFIGVNTGNPNRIVGDALRAQEIPEFKEYDTVKSEVKYGSENSRIDFYLTDSKGTLPPFYLEVKNVHSREGDLATFPDCETTRGAKHLRELTQVIDSGLGKSGVIYLAQRQDCQEFAIAAHLDPNYQLEYEKAVKSGVLMVCYVCEMSPQGIKINKRLPNYKGVFKGH